ncbi:Glycerophosphoryl diester phosphodiesterase [Roseomonas mucosa]|uniref:Glycerophosphoryl diester phosphodiesterase n=1 Tax=Roseomonas mucosa TaxID=207340 RepID=A0A4Y1MV26_9PROT|nr:hypothetical protein [Roseomonas mucosa]AWV21915.1 Glycerophosphoryl diester phosphodiesterase [Roseomonas mucosa]MDT8277507.1 hypothetical protein [Roseomonas mucosa]MDT8355050.1 hypothetical protein [Roseomonas mucosa]MDU7522034.1 hypothetical protein [Roseomonas mucosa]
MPDPRIVAHRGCSAFHRENSPAALRRMAGEGASGFLVNDPAAARRALAA